MREAFERLWEEATLAIIALGIALGYALASLAQGVGQTLTGLTVDTGDDAFSSGSGDWLAWNVGGHVLNVAPTVGGLVEVAVVLAIAAVVVRRLDRS